MSYVKICSNCGSENEKENHFCLRCGRGLSNQDLQPIQVYSNSEITYSPARTNNYRWIRLLAGIFKWLAIISFIGSLFSVVGVNVIMNRVGSDSVYAILPSYAILSFYAIALFSGLFFTSMFALLSEGINLLVDLEANTRQTAKTLERLLRSQD